MRSDNITKVQLQCLIMLATEFNKGEYRPLKPFAHELEAVQ